MNMSDKERETSLHCKMQLQLLIVKPDYEISENIRFQKESHVEILQPPLPSHPILNARHESLDVVRKQLTSLAKSQQNGVKA